MDHIPSPAQLTSQDVAERLAAVEVASQHPEACRPLAACLAVAAGDVDDAVAMLAAEALEMLGPPPKQSIFELIRLVESTREGETQYWAVTLLGRLGPAAAAATPALCHALDHSAYLPVRERAAWALARIGTAAEAATPMLQKAAEEGPPRLARLATQALESVRGMAA